MMRSLIPHSKPYINNLTIRAVQEQVESGLLARGEKTLEFCKELKNYTKLPYLQVTSSGTSALFIALTSLGVSKGSEVILPTYVCQSVSDAIIMAGGTPVFSDISQFWVLDDSNIEQLITPRTKAIIVVHTFGILANIASFKKFGLPIIEDACQCFINEISNKKLGIDSDFIFYSFHATKCISTAEGGAVACVNLKYKDRFMYSCEKYMMFLNFTDIQAAMGIAQLNSYYQMIDRRKEIAAYYFTNIDPNLIKNFGLVEDCMYFRFILTIDRPFDFFFQFMKDGGVIVRKGVDALLHRQHVTDSKAFENADSIYERSVSIPIYPALEDFEVERIVKRIKQFL